MSKYYGEPFTEHMHEILVNNGIQLRTTEQLLKINGTRKVESISTNAGEYEIDAVVFAVAACRFVAGTRTRTCGRI
jgi:hypothetical protein